MIKLNKVATAGLALATAMSLSGGSMFIAQVGAITADDLADMSTEELIALLTELLSVGGDSSASACHNWTVDLTVGSTGADVTALQEFLVDADTGSAAASLNAAFSSGVTMGYFGGLTQAAMAEYQAAQGISPPAGYFGPITRAHLDGVCAAGVDDDDDDDADDDSDSGDLQGGEGSISVKVGASPANNTQVEYNTKTKVMTVEIEALEGSDVEVRRMDFHFEDRMWLLVDAISVEVDGDEIFSDSSLSSSDFTEVTSGSDYRLRVDEDFVVDEGDTAKVAVYLTGKSLLSSGNLAKTPEVWMKTGSVRFVDANGLSQTDGGSTDVASTSSVSREIAFSSDNDATVEVYENGDYNPEEGVIITNSTNTTQKKTVLVFEYEVENDEVELNDVNITANSTTADLDDIVSLAELYLDSDEDGVADDSELIDSWSAFASATTDEIEFDDGGDNLNLELDPGTHTFIVTVDLKKNDGTNYNDGEEIGFDLDAGLTLQNQTSDFTAVSISPDTDVLGPQLHLYNAAPTISNVEISQFVVQENNADLATGTLEFDIKANGGTIYFNGDDEGTAANWGVVGDENGSNTTDTYSYSMTGYTSVTNSGADNEYYTLNNGKTGHVTVTVTLDNATSEQVGWAVTTLEWGDTVTNDTTRSEFSIDWVELIDEMTFNKVYLKS